MSFTVPSVSVNSLGRLAKVSLKLKAVIFVSKSKENMSICSDAAVTGVGYFCEGQRRWELDTVRPHLHILISQHE